jgi:MYXO-CTERM domain-containing protein
MQEERRELEATGWALGLLAASAVALLVLIRRRHR